MSIKSKVRALLNDYLSDSNREYVTDAGVIINKDQASDIKNPTVPFARTRWISDPFRSQRSRKRNVDFVRPEYDLPTVANAVQLDGILNRSNNVFVEQIMKNGFEYKAKSDRVNRHIKRRITEIENFTNISYYELMGQVARQLVTYANCYIIKVRGNNSRYGKPYRLYGKEHKPIVGLFVAEATTMQVGLNNKGQVVEYKQLVNGIERYWDARDVIHLAYNKIPGTTTGKTPILAVLDDVRALRKLEEEIEILGFQYSIPLYLYKVGNKDIPAAPGEIAEAAAHVNSMPAYGMLVVPGHHTIEVPSNSNTPVDIIEFVRHFKSRIYAGLGVSPVAMGEVACYDEETLTLTDTGWKSYKDIDISRDKIATYDPHNNYLIYHTPNAQNIHNHSGKMIHFTGKHIDVKVTPDHEMWIMIRHSGERKKVFAHELASGKYPEFCFIDRINESHGPRTLPGTFSLDGKEIANLDILKLMGWYVSEGCLDTHNASLGRYRTIISQKKEPYVSEIRALLEATKLSYSEHINKRTGVTDFRIYGKEFYHFMLNNCGHLCDNKFISDDFKATCSVYAKILVDTMMKGDGSWGPNNAGTYYTTSTTLRDDFAQLAFEAGYQTKISNKSYVGGGGEIGSLGTLPVYRVNITKSDKDYEILTVDHIEEVDYSGVVYCYNVPNHLFITMRNGKITIQGNTSNRNTGEILDVSMQNITKSYQGIIKYKNQMEFLREILLDGGYNPLSEHYEFNFPEIDLENQIKKETNILQKFQNNLIGRPEARMEMEYDRQIIDEDTFLRLVEIPKIQAEAAAKAKAGIAIQKSKPAPSSSSTKNKRTTSNKVAPANQHGKSTGRPKFVKNHLIGTKEITDSLILLDVSNSNTARNKFLMRVSKSLISNCENLLDDYINFYKNKYSLPDDIDINYALFDSYSDDLVMLLKDKITRFNGASVDKTEELYTTIIDFIFDQEDKVKNLAKILLYDSMGFRTILIETHNCELHSSRNIETDSFTFHKIPPSGYECKCEIEEESFHEFI